MPLPDVPTYQVLGAFAPEPDHERKDPMDYDAWKLATPEDPLDDDEQARIEAAEDLYWERLADRNGDKY